MQSSIIRIGNSKGVRLTKEVLIRSGIKEDVIITVKPGVIKITPVKVNRAGNDLTVASEASFAKDWLRPEEEEAWRSYQLDK